MPIGNIDTYSDIDLDVGSHPLTGDIRKKTKENCLKQAIKSLLLTNPGERLFQPSWGCSLKTYLFEPVSASVSMEIQETVKLALENFEKRIEVIDVICDINQRSNGYNIYLFYNLIGTNTVMEQSIELLELIERVR